jgi:hypothetical protein
MDGGGGGEGVERLGVGVEGKRPWLCAWEGVFATCVKAYDLQVDVRCEGVEP